MTLIIIGTDLEVTLKELDNDPRQFKEKKTWINEIGVDKIVKMKTTFSYSGFNIQSLNQFFDFRNIGFPTSICIL